MVDAQLLIRQEARIRFASADTLFFLGPRKPFPGAISTLCTWTLRSIDGLYVV